MSALFNTNQTTGHKVTAAEVEDNCPEDLQNLAREINALIERMDKQVEHVKDQSVTVDQLLTQAKKRCDKGGFKAFREKFFPDMGKSRFYELLQVATDKRSLKEIRAITRERVAKHRANKANSVTVTEKPSSIPKPDEAPCVVSGQTPEPAAKPRSAVKSKDEALSKFTDVVLELVRRTTNRKAKHFTGTGVPARSLATLGKFLSDLAILKKADASKPMPTTRPKGNGTVSPEQSADERKAQYAALDAADDQAG
jgi:hypothetical protein